MTRQTPGRRAVGGLLALAVAALGMAAIGLMSAEAKAAGEAPAAAASSREPITASVDEGRILYLQNCSSCHGPNLGGTAYGPAIEGAGPALIDYVLRTGRMPQPHEGSQSQRRERIFTDDQIASIVAYVVAIGGRGPDIPAVNVDGADLALGRELYILNCAACHGPAGAGGAVGGGFVAPPLGESEPVVIGEAVVVGPAIMPPFEFEPDELDAIVAYVVALRTMPTPGGLAVAALGPVPEGFIAVFVGLVGMIVLVRWVGRRPT